MISLDEDALICDLAETYHIYNYKQLPPNLVATFACGLREESRIKMRMADEHISSDTLLSAYTVDALNTLIWLNSNGGKRPKSVMEALLARNKKIENTIMSYQSVDEFNKARQKILGGDDCD